MKDSSIIISFFELRSECCHSSQEWLARNRHRGLRWIVKRIVRSAELPYAAGSGVTPSYGDLSCPAGHLAYRSSSPESRDVCKRFYALLMALATNTPDCRVQFSDWPTIKKFLDDGHVADKLGD